MLHVLDTVSFLCLSLLLVTALLSDNIICADDGLKRNRKANKMYGVQDTWISNLCFINHIAACLADNHITFQV